MTHRPLGVPDTAEVLDLLECTSVKRVPSRIAPHLTAYVEDFKCPACQEPQPEPRADRATSCSKCGLNMRAFVGRLFIWRNDVPARQEATADA